MIEIHLIVNIIPRNAAQLLALQFFTLQFFALQFFAQVRMNPSTVSKGGCMAGRFSRSTLGSSSTSSSSSSGNGIFRPYEGRREEFVVVHDLNVEALPNWLLKNSLSDCVYQNDENSLRRRMTEIKTYEEVCTGKMVSCLQIDMNICIILSLLSGSGQVPLRSSHGQSCRECLEDMLVWLA